MPEKIVLPKRRSSSHPAKPESSLDAITSNRKKRATQRLEIAEIEETAAEMEYRTREYEKGHQTVAGDKETHTVVDVNADKAEDIVKEVDVNQPIVIGKHDKEEDPKVRYSIVDGHVMRDPEGDFETVKDALAEKASNKPEEKPAYYFLNPLTNQMEAATGPVMIPQREQPIIERIMPDGSIEVVKAGTPIIIKEKGTEPKKVWFIDTDGKMVEHNPDEPIIINKSGKEKETYTIAGLTGLDGKPLELTEKGLDVQLKVLDYNENKKREDDRYGSMVDFATTIKTGLPELMSAFAAYLSAQAGKKTAVKTAPGGGETAPSEEIQVEPKVVTCPDCNMQLGVLPDMKTCFCVGCGKQIDVQ